MGVMDVTAESLAAMFKEIGPHLDERQRRLLMGAQARGLGHGGPEEGGDPGSPLRWTVKSTRNLAAELTRQGHRVSADTAGDLLREEGFSLQGNAKTIEGQRHPDRDAQFRYINEQVKDHQGSADPVISVDTKKKELVGQFKNAGREWRPKGQPAASRTHD